MNTCVIDSKLIWIMRDVDGAVKDIVRKVGFENAEKFRIILKPTRIASTITFHLQIQGPEEYHALIEKVAYQQIV